jgi:erythromycin esterase
LRPAVRWTPRTALVLAVIACTSPRLPSPAAGPQQQGTTADALSTAESVKRSAWLRANAAPLRSLDPADDDFSDLAPLGRAIGDARIVSLGEGRHGEGGASLGKTRLVKYLHEKLGFDVLVFEGGFYEGTKTWEMILGGDDPMQALKLSVAPAWSWSGEIEPLAAYLAAQAHTARPLVFEGYDPQGSPVSRARQSVELRAYLDSTGLGGRFAEDSSFWRGLFWLQRTWTPADSLSGDSARVDRFVEGARRVRAALAERSAEPGSRFWQQVLESSMTFARQMRQTRLEIAAKGSRAGQDGNDYTSSNMREEQAARNMLWLANDKHRGQRLIVWSATVHAARNLAGVDTRDTAWSYRGYSTVGHHLWQALGKQTYTIGFVALSGSSRLGPDSSLIRSNQHPDAELEELMGAAGFQTAFLDYRHIARGGAWLREPFLSRPFAEYAMIARWPDVLDGVVFVREMQPATWPDFEARLKASRPPPPL